MSSTALRQEAMELDDFDRRLLRSLQGGFPIQSSPYSVLASELGCKPGDVLAGIGSLINRGVVTRFGPLIDIERAGGAFSLCALKVPETRFDKVAEIVNGYDEVAHNYQRTHDWNMWFVLAGESRTELDATFAAIVEQTACPGMNLPKEREYFVGLYFDV